MKDLINDGIIECPTFLNETIFMASPDIYISVIVNLIRLHNLAIFFLNDLQLSSSKINEIYNLLNEGIQNKVILFHTLIENSTRPSPPIPPLLPQLLRFLR